MTDLSFAAETVRDARRFWLILQEPGCVPERKGPWLSTGTKEILREFIALRPSAYIHHLTVDEQGVPHVQHGPELLQMLDGRSMATGRKHNVRVRAAHAIAMEARQRTDPEEGLDPKGDGAGQQDIAR